MDNHIKKGGHIQQQNTALFRIVKLLEKARTKLSPQLSLEEKRRQDNAKSRAAQKELDINQIPNSLRLTWVFHSKALPRFQTVMQYLKASCVVPCIPGESQAGAHPFKWQLEVEAKVREVCTAFPWRDGAEVYQRKCLKGGKGAS